MTPIAGVSGVVQFVCVFVLGNDAFAGTINYSFCAYTASPIGTNATRDEGDLGDGKCPVVTGESLKCSDLSSLYNCYDSGYVCTVDEEGLCHCTH